MDTVDKSDVSLETYYGYYALAAVIVYTKDAKDLMDNATKALLALRFGDISKCCITGYAVIDDENKTVERSIKGGLYG